MTAMAELRATCDCCGGDRSTGAAKRMFWGDCVTPRTGAQRLGSVRPNGGGAVRHRRLRPVDALARFPASTARAPKSEVFRHV